MKPSLSIKVSLVVVLSLFLLTACGSPPALGRFLTPVPTTTEAFVQKPLNSTAPALPPTTSTLETVGGTPTPTAPQITPTPNTTPNTTPTLTPSPEILSHQRLTITSIHMVTATNGWGTGYIATGNYGSGAQPLYGDILRTVDGGVQWQNVSPHGITPDSVAALYFLDDQNAWVAVSLLSNQSVAVTVYHTADGGQTWRDSASISLPGGGPESIEFVDAQHGWMLASLGQGSGSESVEILKTSDGGLHWDMVTLTSGLSNQSSPGSLPFRCTKDGIIFLNTRLGWATGTCPGGQPFLYTTQDGGQTWQSQSLSPSPGSAPNLFANCQCGLTPPSFVSPLTGFLSIQIQGATPNTFLYVTHDGGQSWTPLDLPVTHLMSNPEFINANDGWVTDGQELYVTHDGGQSWTPVVGLPVMGQAGSLDFVDINNGWISDGQLLYVTHDEGQNWAITTPYIASIPSANFLERIVFPDGIIALTFAANLTQGVAQGYVLQLQAHQMLFITLNGGAGVQVLDSQDNPLAAASEQPGPWGVSVPQAGDYTIVLSGQGQVVMTVTLPPLSGSQEFPLPPSRQQSAIQFPTGSSSVKFNKNLVQGVPLAYVVKAQAGQKMTLTAAGELTVAILDPRQNALSPASPQAGQWQLTIPADGAYTIVLMGEGPISMTVQLLSP